MCKSLISWYINSVILLLVDFRMYIELPAPIHTTCINLDYPKSPLSEFTYYIHVVYTLYSVILFM